MAGEPRLTITQFVTIAGGLVAIVGILSGVGGARYAASSDEVQDERIERLDSETRELRAQVMTATNAATETRTTVAGLEGAVAEVKADTKAIRSLLDRLIGTRGGRARVEDEER